MTNPQRAYIWKLIEQYRMSGGREEHWRNTCTNIYQEQNNGN